MTDAAATLDADGRLLVLGGRNALGQALTSVYLTGDLDSVELAPTFVSSPNTAATATVPYSPESMFLRAEC